MKRIIIKCDKCDVIIKQTVLNIKVKKERFGSMRGKDLCKTCDNLLKTAFNK